MQALAMHYDEKLQRAVSPGQQTCIILHPNSPIKMRFFLSQFGFPIAVPHAEWIHFTSLSLLLGNSLWVNQVLLSVRRCYNLTPITGSD